MYKIAIVEFSQSHEECIYTQVKFLTEAGYSVDLILHKSLRNQISSYSSLCNEVKFITPKKKGFFKKLKQQFQLLKVLKKYNLLIFNTASSSKMVRNISFLLLSSGVQCVGILHNARKLKSSFTQKVISLKIKKYFVLSDAILKNLVKKNNCQIASFYPIFFPNHHEAIKKPNDEIWVSVPGRIDWERRDYLTLINALSTVKTNNRIKFLFLGKLDKDSKNGQYLWGLIKNHNLEEHFICFDKFISNAKYQAMLKASDYIMPLLTNDENYLKYKISGSFNLAYAYKKPMICKMFFEQLKDLKENALFYKEDKLIKLLEELNKNKIQAGSNYHNPKWNFEFQQSKYLNLLDLPSS